MKNVKGFICRLEGYKSAFIELHWTSGSMGMHELCKKACDTICDFQDDISELYQSGGKNWKRNTLKAVSIHVPDGIDAAQQVLMSLLKELSSVKGSDEAEQTVIDDFRVDIKKLIYQCDVECGKKLDNIVKESLYRVLGWI